MISILTPATNIVSYWSGGQTNQLYIWPEGSDFKSGDFQFRISTATVEVGESVFTKLQDVDRTLIVLDGQITLDHQDHHQKTLNPFEMDHFSGNWETVSKGYCTDFNLMTKGNATSKVSVINLKAGISSQVNIEGDQFFIYSHNKNISLTYSKNHILSCKSLAVFKNEFNTNEITLTSEHDCKVICIRIHL